jgi:hypothetical protein
MKRSIQKLLTGHTGASFSDCLKYRFTLWRVWDIGPTVNFLMLNPSTADDVTNDPTVERCERRAKILGFGGLFVTNLFAYRATAPKEMKLQLDPIGVGNDEAIIETASVCEMVVCAWGEHGSHRYRDDEVFRLLRKNHASKLHYLKISKGGTPSHPLYLPYELKPQRFPHAKYGRA